jgi:hypothetical protein
MRQSTLDESSTEQDEAERATLGNTAHKATANSFIEASRKLLSVKLSIKAF